MGVRGGRRTGFQNSLVLSFPALLEAGFLQDLFIFFWMGELATSWGRAFLVLTAAIPRRQGWSHHVLG